MAVTDGKTKSVDDKLDLEKLINDYYIDKFYPNVRFPVNLDQIMYQLVQTLKVFVI